MRALVLAPLLLLAACQSGSDTAVTGASPDEARQLDEAAATIDINSSVNVVENIQ